MPQGYSSLIRLLPSVGWYVVGSFSDEINCAKFHLHYTNSFGQRVFPLT